MIKDLQIFNLSYQFTLFQERLINSHSQCNINCFNWKQSKQQKCKDVLPSNFGFFRHLTFLMKQSCNGYIPWLAFSMSDPMLSGNNLFTTSLRSFVETSLVIISTIFFLIARTCVVLAYAVFFTLFCRFLVKPIANNLSK